MPVASHNAAQVRPAVFTEAEWPGEHTVWPTFVLDTETFAWGLLLQAQNWFHSSAWSSGSHPLRIDAYLLDGSYGRGPRGVKQSTKPGSAASVCLAPIL